LVGCKRIPAVKGQTLAAIRSREQSLEWVFPIRYPHKAQTIHSCGIYTGLGARDSKLKTAIEKQINSATIDNFNCIICTSSYLVTDTTIFPDLFKGAFGVDWSYEKARNIGRKTIMLEREFNKKSGFTAADDKLPDFFYTDKNATGVVLTIRGRTSSRVEALAFVDYRV
jgi:aldehyde:ferredoxin oxidoreductase